MLFNSIDFAVFLPIVFILYWFVTNKNLRIQNIFVATASYVFYGWWDWRFLGLIFLSTLIDYSAGIWLMNEEDPRRRKFFLWISIVFNLGILGYLKYANFFMQSFADAYSFFGKPFQGEVLHVVLPVGISFYTFQTMSYSIDIYRRKLTPTKDFIAFSAFVSFFPQLVAGPIERASNLLPQFYKKREFNYLQAVDGMRQILWGLFKKMVIADNCAYFANQIFNNYASYPGSSLVLGALFFTFQIYCDFSGYSDIAIGTARLFGFNLMQNFAFPYFSRDVAEFWRRWHISLSSWFRDYLYIPLGGSRGSRTKVIRNIIIIFAVSGFWHGANWTFIVWGLLNAAYFMPLLIFNRNRKNLEIVGAGNQPITATEILSIIGTFAVTVLAWIFFRSPNLHFAYYYLRHMFSASLFFIPQLPQSATTVTGSILAVLLAFLLVIEWRGREHLYALESLGLHWKKPVRLAFYYLIAIVIFLYQGHQQSFIYFQF